MRLAWAAVVLVTGCFGPVPATGIPCAANGECPEPLVCDRARALPTCERSLSDAPPPDIAIDSAVPIDAAIDAGFGPCLVDDFNDGSAADWTIVDPTWTVVDGQGPDNSAAFIASPNTGDHVITHPAMRAVRRAHLALDFRMDTGATSDFTIYLVPPGWTDPNGATQARYFVGLYVLGGDSGPDDRIVRSLPPAAFVEVATHAVSVPAGTWRHLDLRYAETGAIQIELDGAPYMESPADTLLPGPLDLLVRFWANGAIDNVRLDCVR